MNFLESLERESQTHTPHGMSNEQTYEWKVLQLTGSKLLCLNTQQIYKI